MKLKSGLPYWLIQDGLKYDYSPLRKSYTTDVAILGGGISGALAAYRLTQEGYRCVVLDKRSIGLGSTCCSTSLLQYELDLPLHTLSQKIPAENAAMAYRVCYQAVDDLEKICKDIQFKEFYHTESVYMAAYKKDIALLDREYNARASLGFDVRLLDEKQLSRYDGIQGYAAIVSRKAAVTNAYGLTHALLQYVQNKSGIVCDRTVITRITHHKKSVSLRTDKGLLVKARFLLYANGYEAIHQLDSIKTHLKIYQTYAFASEQNYEQKDFFTRQFILWNTANPYFYMRKTENNRIIAGGRDELYVNEKLAAAQIDNKTKLLVKDFKKIFPNITCNPEYSWCGPFATTRDSLPFIGEHKKFPNGFFALGYAGNGIIYSVIAAQLFMDMLAGRTRQHASVFSFNRINH